jgi:Tol biopolymer transport system component
MLPACLAVLASLPARGQEAATGMVVAQDVSWSGDGRLLFFSAMRVKRDYSDYTPDKWAVYRFDLATSTVTRIATSAFTVAASPREPLLIVGKLVGGNRDLYLVDTAGREVARVTSDPAEDFGATWSPDGSRIAFTSKRGGHSEAFVADRDGSNVRRLTQQSTDRTLNPSWSPDGRHITYYREKGDGQDQVFVISSDGSGDRNVTNDAFNNVYPGWAPDGRVVYGQGQRNTPASAFTVAIDGTGKRPLLGIRSFFTRFSPDGMRIAYIEQEPAGTRVVVARRDGTVQVTVPLDEVR